MTLSGEKKAQILKTPDYYIEVVIKKRWFLLVSVFLALSAGIAASLILPRVYQAQTIILVEPKKVSDDYVKAINNTDTTSRVNTIKQQIESRTNLEKIIEQYKLFSKPEHQRMYPEDKLENLRRRISISTNKSHRGTEAFTISFKDTKPKTARDVTNSIASTFINESLKYRETEAFGTTDFLEGRLKETEERLKDIEKNIEEYKVRYMGELPEQLQTNLRNLDRLQLQMNEKQASLRDAKNRLLLLQNQATIESMKDRGKPVAALVKPKKGGGQEMPSDLDQLRDMLTDLKARYKEAHPDVVRVKQMISVLEKEERRKEKERKERKEKNKAGTDQTGPDGAPADSKDAESAGDSSETHPMIVIQEQEIKTEIKNLEKDIQSIRDEIKMYERRVENTPKRETELLSLKRDYDNIRASYNSLKDRNLEAEIASDLIMKQKGETFRILDPAKLPQRPISPNVMKLFVLFAGAGFAVGGGLIIGLDFLDASFRKVNHVETYLDLPVLTTIPKIYTRKQSFLKKANIGLSVLFLLIDTLLLGVFGILVMKGVDQTIEMVKRVGGL